VVSDATSCVEGIEAIVDEVERTRGRRITVLDAVQFAADTLLPRIDVLTLLPTLALHPTCSSTRLGLNGALMTVAQAIAVEVSVPDDWGCCGFAGDRGLLHPELTESATASQGNWIRDRDFSAYASSNRTCEIAMTRATGRPYRHILEILADSILTVGMNDRAITTPDWKSSS
jgi:D-lactate dehydrogenase